jgi:hypothetical protein
MSRPIHNPAPFFGSNRDLGQRTQRPLPCRMALPHRLQTTSHLDFPIHDEQKTAGIDRLMEGLRAKALPLSMQVLSITAAATLILHPVGKSDTTRR